jgi:hypothetical protein
MPSRAIAVVESCTSSMTAVGLDMKSHHDATEASALISLTVCFCPVAG